LAFIYFTLSRRRRRNIRNLLHNMKIPEREVFNVISIIDINPKASLYSSLIIFFTTFVLSRFVTMREDYLTGDGQRLDPVEKEIEKALRPLSFEDFTGDRKSTRLNSSHVKI